MKKLFIILGLITSVTAVILSVTRFSNSAVIPILIAFISGLVVLFLSKKEQTKTKTIQYIFLLIIISLSLTIYKGVFNTPTVDSTEQLEKEGEETIEDSKETLDEREID